MRDGSAPSVLRRYWRLLAVIAAAVGLSSATMVLAAGGSGAEAAIVGTVGLAVGVGVAGYVYHLMRTARNH